MFNVMHALRITGALSQRKYIGSVLALVQSRICSSIWLYSF